MVLGVMLQDVLEDLLGSANDVRDTLFQHFAVLSRLEKLVVEVVELLFPAPSFGIPKSNERLLQAPLQLGKHFVRQIPRRSDVTFHTRSIQVGL